MSLDVYLRVRNRQNNAAQRQEPRIFIREAGQRKALSRAEWDIRFPGREPVVALPSDDDADAACVYSANITHNLRRMAEAAGLSGALWCPDEQGITTAQQLIPPLREGLARLHASPETYRPLNPANGWGSYEVLVGFVAEYLEACEAFPQAEVSVWR